MGKLSGYRYRDIIKILKIFGFEFHRQAAGSHELWYNVKTNKYTTLRAILKQADIDVNEFVKL